MKSRLGGKQSISQNKSLSDIKHIFGSFLFISEWENKYIVFLGLACLAAPFL
jgi:hypothetical protein